MKRQLSIVALALTALTATAQETYQDATLLRPELNGTARYVGMGGAMEALGADISTMGTNPAGIGLFRHSTASLSFGVISQQDAAKMEGADKTHASFDQAGFVYTMRTGRNSFLNFGFNYTKSRDFNNILQAAGMARNSSQNQVTYDKAGHELFDVQEDNTGLYSNSLACSQLDILHLNHTIYSPDYEPEWGYYESDSYNYIATDRLNGNDNNAGHYTKADVEKFDTYIEQQLAKIDIPNKDNDFLRNCMLTMYSNPLVNYTEAMKQNEQQAG